VTGASAYHQDNSSKKTAIYLRSREVSNSPPETGYSSGETFVPRWPQHSDGIKTNTYKYRGGAVKVRKPRGFHPWAVPIGVLFVSEEEEGRWVVLAGDPAVKIDNKHLNGRPHMHAGDWNSCDRRLLREDLTVDEAADTIRHLLETKGHIDLQALEDRLK